MNINPELLTEQERAVFASRFEGGKRQRNFQEVIEILTRGLCHARQAAAAALSDLSGACNDSEDVNHAPLVGVAMVRLQRAADPDAPPVRCECDRDPSALCQTCDGPVCPDCSEEVDGLLVCEGCGGGEDEEEG